MQRRISPFCKNSNYFCKCYKCKQALEYMKKVELSEIEREIKIQRDCSSSRGKLSDELMREVL